MKGLPGLMKDAFTGFFLFPKMEEFAASMAHATSVGTALSIHYAWNKKLLPNDIIELKYFSTIHPVVL